MLFYSAFDDRKQPRLYARDLSSGRTAALTDGANVEGLARAAQAHARGEVTDDGDARDTLDHGSSEVRDWLSDRGTDEDDRDASLAYVPTVVAMIVIGVGAFFGRGYENNFGVDFASPGGGREASGRSPGGRRCGRRRWCV